MKSPITYILLTLILQLGSSICTFGQEENATVIKEGNHYVGLKLKSLEKLNKRIERQQDQLLKKLKKKEKHLAHELKNTDSLAYAKYKHQNLSYDSISKVSKSDTGSNAVKISKKKNAAIDSLRGVQSFVQSNSGVSASAPEVQGQSAELNSMQGKLNFRNYINQLITQRTNDLKNLASSSSSNIPGLTSIQKQVFYFKSRIKVFTDMEEDPTKVEDKAMEYLQGTDGFDKALKNSTDGGGGGGMQSLAESGGDPSQLEKMGYQTKALVLSDLQKNFGGNLGLVTKQLTAEVGQWQEKQSELSEIKDTKNSIEKLRGTAKPAFKVNPMTGLPFWKRIQKQYSWQTTRPSTDGLQPAIVTPAVMAGFKHTPKLIYGVGIATSIGLGENWQNVHLTYRGVGLRTFTTWEWQYKIGLYAGYERTYKAFVFTQNSQTPSTEVASTQHNNANYEESLLLGLTKSYRLNNKNNGAIQVLYDFWWQEKGLRSPFVIRFVTMTK